MATKNALTRWIIEALQSYEGSASLIQVCEFVWRKSESQLRDSGDLYFTWQYDIRWAAHSLRVSRKLRLANSSPRGIWELI